MNVVTCAKAWADYNAGNLRARAAYLVRLWRKTPMRSKTLDLQLKHTCMLNKWPRSQKVQTLKDVLTATRPAAAEDPATLASGSGSSDSLTSQGVEGEVAAAVPEPASEAAEAAAAKEPKTEDPVAAGQVKPDAEDPVTADPVKPEAEHPVGELEPGPACAVEDLPPQSPAVIVSPDDAPTLPMDADVDAVEAWPPRPWLPKSNVMRWMPPKTLKDRNTCMKTCMQDTPASDVDAKMAQQKQEAWEKKQTTLSTALFGAAAEPKIEAAKSDHLLKRLQDDSFGAAAALPKQEEAGKMCPNSSRSLRW